jgi:hypothetical protein
MTNGTPPEPRQPILSFDEWVGIIVAFGTIGTILVVSLLDEEGRIRLRSPFGTEPEESRLLSEEPGEEILPRERFPVAPLPPLVREDDLIERVEIEPDEQRRVITIAPIPTAEPPVVPEAQPDAPEETIRFSDVPEGFWASPYIYELAQAGVIEGFPDNTFRPNQPVTRAEYATILGQAFEQQQDLAVPNFEDITQDFWALSAVQEAARTGFLRGYPDDTFRPDLEIPRVQVLVSLASGLGWQPSGNPQDILETYEDAASIPDYAREQVAAATEAGLRLHSPQTRELNPTEPATRAEIAAWVYQALAEAGKVEKIEPR